MQVEEVCCDFEQDGIYVTIINKCPVVVCHYCPKKLKVAFNQIKNNLRENVTYVHMQLMRDFDMSKDYDFFPDMQKPNLYLTSDSDVIPVLSTSDSFRSTLCISTTESVHTLCRTLLFTLYANTKFKAIQVVG